MKQCRFTMLMYNLY